MTQYNIEQLQHHYLDDVGALWREEGWISTDDYVDMVYRLQPKGFFGAVSTNGELLCVCFVWIIDDKHARVARIVTKKGYRGKGIGKKVISEALEYLGDRNIGLSAAEGTQPLYSSFGFNWTSCRVTKIVGQVDHQQVNLLPNPSPECAVVPLDKVNIEDIFCYDLTIHRVQRKELLLERLSPKRSQNVVALNKEGQVRGYASCWIGYKCHRIMPLYADDVTVARILLKQVIGLCPLNEKIQVLSFLDNLEAINLLSSVISGEHRLKGPAQVAVQMFTKAIVPVDANRVFTLFDLDGSFG